VLTGKTGRLSGTGSAKEQIEEVFDSFLVANRARFKNQSLASRFLRAVWCLALRGVDLRKFNQFAGYVILHRFALWPFGFWSGLFNYRQMSLFSTVLFDS